mmetsp:Transcript_52137/g.135202  ORF Transcript_52137/g.135202 Transcript_52137/m.135202 type:complete len:221 (-) Transcript_52137:41-703(-)
MVAPPNNISCHSGAHAACTRPRPSPLGTSTHSRAARAPAPAVERGGRRGVWGAPLGARRRLGGQDEADDQAVQAESLREDQDEDHADVELRLLGRRAHASVAHNADRNACSHAAEAAREASCEVRVAGERRVLRDATGRRRNAVGDDDGNDEAVDAEHTRHDHGDDRLHHQIRLHHTHRRDADARLGSAVRRTQIGEDERDRRTHEAEERRARGAQLRRH